MEAAVGRAARSCRSSEGRVSSWRIKKEGEDGLHVRKRESGRHPVPCRRRKVGDRLIFYTSTFSNLD